MGEDPIPGGCEDPLTCYAVAAPPGVLGGRVRILPLVRGIGVARRRLQARRLRGDVSLLRL